MIREDKDRRDVAAGVSLGQECRAQRGLRRKQESVTDRPPDITLKAVTPASAFCNRL